MLWCSSLVRIIKTIINWQILILRLGVEAKSVREPIETAFTFVTPVSYPILWKELHSSEASSYLHTNNILNTSLILLNKLAAYPEGEKSKQRKKGQLRLMTSLSYIYRIQIENCKKSQLAEPSSALLFKEFVRVLELQIAKFPAVAQGDNPGDVYFLRYNINILLGRLAQEASLGQTEKRKTLAERGIKDQSLLYQYAMDTSACGPNSSEIYELEDPLVAPYSASNEDFKVRTNFSLTLFLSKTNEHEIG